MLPKYAKDSDQKMALKQIVEDLRKEKYNGVFVPRRGRQQPCQWKVKGAGSRSTWKYVWLPFQSLLEVAEFSLDHAIVKLGATLYKQISGIPMGDPLSPGMTIGTCCWMENKWMQEVQDKDKQTFRAKRYMDDILIWIMVYQIIWGTRDRRH